MQALKNNDGVSDNLSSSQFEGLLVEASQAARQAAREDIQRFVAASDSKALVTSNGARASESLIQSEAKVKGSVGWEIYLHYGKACGGVYVILGYEFIQLCIVFNHML